MSKKPSGESDATVIAKQIVDYLKQAEESDYVARLYIRGCEALLITGTRKEECGAKFAKIIRDLKYPDEPKREWHSGYYWEVVKQNGFTKSGNTPEQESENSSPFTLRLIPEQPETYMKSPCYVQRMRMLDVLMRDRFFTDRMIDQLQCNYHTKVDPVSGDNLPDLDNPIDWNSLFASPDGQGMTLDPPEVVNDYFLMMQGLHRKMLDVLRWCMDDRQALMPWMLYPLKVVTTVTSKAHGGKKYYAMLKRKFDITTKKITQFGTSDQTVADYLNFVKDDAWQFGFCEFIPCPRCYKHGVNDGRERLLQMRPLEDGTWKWHCRNCDGTFPAGLIKEKFLSVVLNRGGCATVYMQKNGLPLPDPREPEVEQTNK